MDTIGIICEYNPFHAGHKKQIDAIRALRGCGSAIVCLMSGNFVQRGAPAILDKTLRARSALRCGADLVLELPTEIALSSAEGFASGGVSILSGLCGELCFGTENADTDVLMDTAEALLDSRYPFLLKQALTSGSPFPPPVSRRWRKWDWTLRFSPARTPFWPWNTARRFWRRAAR